MAFTLFGYKIQSLKEVEGQKLEIEKLKVKPTSKATDKQTTAAAKATAIRTTRAKEKIVNAVNLLRLEGKNISEYAVAKESGCSINTVKKYREFIDLQKKE